MLLLQDCRACFIAEQYLGFGWKRFLFGFDRKVELYRFETRTHTLDLDTYEGVSISTLPFKMPE